MVVLILVAQLLGVEVLVQATVAMEQQELLIQAAAAAVVALKHTAVLGDQV